MNIKYVSRSFPEHSISQRLRCWLLWLTLASLPSFRNPTTISAKELGRPSPQQEAEIRVLIISFPF